MSTISIKAEVPEGQLLEALGRLPPAEFDHLFDQMTRLRAQRRSGNLTGPEATLLQRINEGLPALDWERLKVLTDKREEESLAPEELAELQRLTDHAESAQARRCQALGELARLRGVPLTALMAELAIQPQGHG